MSSMIFLLILSTFTLFSLVVGTSFADVSIQINGDGTPACEGSNSCFTPSNAKISTGEQITWINSSPVTHSIYSGNPYEGPDGSFEFNLNSGESTTFKFSSVGQYPYYCMVHPWESGIITVTENTNSNANPTTQFYSTKIILDPIPSTVEQGDEIVFSGILTTDDGKYFIPDKTIYIKDDVDFGSDNITSTVMTDKNGRFSIKQIGIPRSDGGSWDFYAVFEGSDTLSKSRSKTYSVYVVESVAYQTKIMLEKIPSLVYVGDTITFTGVLVSDNSPIENALVEIKDDDSFRSDDVLASGKTDSNGYFSIIWIAYQDSVEDELEIYAVFDGNESYSESRSPNQILNIQKHATKITLDPIPSNVNIGDVITFSGVLQLEGRSSEGALVYIKDEDPLGRDDLLTTAIADSRGQFVGWWRVSHVDIDESPAEIYAVFEGNAVYHKSKTCNSSCSNAISLKILDESIDTSKIDDTKYLKLLGAYWDHDNIKVLVMVDPDNAETSKKYLSAVQDGALEWEPYLKTLFPNGKWNIDVTVEPNPITFLDKKYDVLTTVTAKDDYLCEKHALGVAFVGRHQGWNTIPIVVGISDPCNPNQTRSLNEVRSTMAHEFGHALGLEHAYNIDFDLMCSGTCVRDYLSASPSKLNVKALGYIYGEDGFESPNKKSNELSGMKFFGNENISITNSEINVPTTQESDQSSFDVTEETYEKIQIPNWIKVNAKWWAEGKITDADFVRGIEHLIKQGMIRISETASSSGSSQEIPIWIKNMAGWWADGYVSDEDFVKGIEYLVKEGIIRIN